MTSYDARVGSNVSEVTVNAIPTDNAGGVSIRYNTSSSNEITLGAAGS